MLNESGALFVFGVDVVELDEDEVDELDEIFWLGKLLPVDLLLCELKL